MIHNILFLLMIATQILCDATEKEGKNADSIAARLNQFSAVCIVGNFDLKTGKARDITWLKGDTKDKRLHMILEKKAASMSKTLRRVGASNNSYNSFVIGFQDKLPAIGPSQLSRLVFWIRDGKISIVRNGALRGVHLKSIKAKFSVRPTDEEISRGAEAGER